MKVAISGAGVAGTAYWPTGCRTALLTLIEEQAPAFRTGGT